MVCKVLSVRGSFFKGSGQQLFRERVLLRPIPLVKQEKMQISIKSSVDDDDREYYCLILIILLQPWWFLPQSDCEGEAGPQRKERRA